MELARTAVGTEEAVLGAMAPAAPTLAWEGHLQQVAQVHQRVPLARVVTVIFPRLDVVAAVADGMVGGQPRAMDVQAEAALTPQALGQSTRPLTKIQTQMNDSGGPRSATGLFLCYGGNAAIASVPQPLIVEYVCVCVLLWQLRRLCGHF